ncbi:uncharacterized protein LOC112169082 [Rosa chinensis]|uniref:uncharacterized protein LOC112169082 n=1 Tax=Rosa chinensis TaxID=74649 RepID=UPI000D08CF4E|nr:uncharacterized protein LOC112169082 [Rosa chinensis]
MCPLSRIAGIDRYRWMPEKNGKYTVKSAYWIAREKVMGNLLVSSSSGYPYRSLWQKVWNTMVPGKVKICIWRAVNNILPTLESLIHKGYSGSLHCLLCNETWEAISHVLCHCPVAQETMAIANIPIKNCIPCSFKEWLILQSQHLTRDNWECLLMLLWALWKNRNGNLWNDISKTAHEIVVATITWYQQFLQTQQRPKQDKPTYPGKYLTSPVQQQLKINVDGAFLPPQTTGGIGGVIRRKDGSFVACFSKVVQHVSSPKHVELLAIREGIDFLRQIGAQDACLESDCKVAIQEIGDDDFELHEHANLLLDIHHNRHFVRGLDFLFAPRTANAVSHRLAAMAYESNTD